MRLRKVAPGLTAVFIAASGLANSANQPMNLTCERLIDFSNTESNKTTPWYSVNDSVMGGRSLGAFRIENGTLNFFGSINTNGGGFASIRHPLEANALAGTDRLRIAIQTDGRPYTINLRDRTSEALRVAHQAVIPSSDSSSGLQTVEVLYKDLVPTFRGRRVQTELFNPLEATSLSVMLADQQDGPFMAKIAWIEACLPLS
jgi:NADH dehydrogenase [ubiquinone] 1 alpha subcomplex assembly factor 1